MAPRRSSRGNIPPQTPPESNPPNLRRSSRGIASTALTPPEYNPHDLRRSSRGTIAAAEFNSPNIPDTQHCQEFQSNPDEYEDPEDQEFADSEVQTGTTGKRKRAGSSAQKQRKKNTISQLRKRKLSLIGSTSYTAGADFDYPKIAPTEMFPSLTRIRKTAISMEADGSCLFHALADQLYNDPDRGEELRKTVVEFMADNRDVFKAMLPLRDVHDSQSGKLALRWDEDAQFDEYLRLLARDGTWGGELEILAAAEYFGVTIVVRQDNGRFLSYNDDIGGIPAHIGYSRQQLHYYSARNDDQAFRDGANRNMDAVNTEAPLRDDQCTESIVDDDTDINDMTSSSHHTLESSTEEPASVAPSANRRRPQNRWSRAEDERLRGMKDASCSWDEIGEVFPGRSLSSIQNHWGWYKVNRTISRTQYIDL
jgi:hypothetical protein